MINHRPRKRFGQNFLQSPVIIEQLLAHLNVQRDEQVVEIGPGLGALTKPLLKRLDTLTAIEIDRDLQAYLTQTLAQYSLTLINADALTVDYRQFGSGLRIIGNLPYNISTPLLLHLLTFCPIITDMHFMLQKEVVERLAGQPGSKEYGRLSIMVQYHCDVQPLFDVPADAFFPRPKVESAIVRLIPYQHAPYPGVSLEALQQLVALAFAMRRKTLANNLKSVLNASQLQALMIDPGLRPEQITITEYIKIANFIATSIKFK